jgi:hypothetical protein
VHPRHFTSGGNNVVPTRDEIIVILRGVFYDQTVILSEDLLKPCEYVITRLNRMTVNNAGAILTVTKSEIGI